MDGASPSSLQVTKRDTRSSVSRLSHPALRLYAPLLNRLSKPLPAGSPKLVVPSGVRKKCDLNERQVEETWLFDLTSKQSRAKSEPACQRSRTRRIYCLAGGSFRTPPSSDHWKTYAYIAKRLPEATVSVLSPPLAPNSPAPTTFPHLVKLFKSLLSSSNQTGEAVTFLGDSSGGNLVLALTLEALKDASVPAPQSIFLLCPSVDHRHRNPAIRELQKKDPILRLATELKTSVDWAGDWELEDVRISPILADLKALKERGVKVHGLTAGYDILTPDALLFRDKLSELGVQGNWLEWDKQMHVFPLAFSYRIPESVQGMKWIVDVLMSERGGESQPAIDQEDVSVRNRGTAAGE